MIPVDQTLFKAEVGDDAGNCLQAAVASLLELDLDDVPHFAAIPGDNGEWWDAFVMFARSHGYGVVVSTLALDHALGLCAGMSPRAPAPPADGWAHVVVTLGPDVVHDPHPDRTNLNPADDRMPLTYYYLVPFDPKEGRYHDLDDTP